MQRSQQHTAPGSLLSLTIRQIDAIVTFLSSAADDAGTVSLDELRSFIGEYHGQLLQLVDEVLSERSASVRLSYTDALEVLDQVNLSLQDRQREHHGTAFVSDVDAAVELNPLTDPRFARDIRTVVEPLPTSSDRAKVLNDVLSISLPICMELVEDYCPTHSVLATVDPDWETLAGMIMTVTCFNNGDLDPFSRYLEAFSVVDGNGSGEVTPYEAAHVLGSREWTMEILLAIQKNDGFEQLFSRRKSEGRQSNELCLAQCRAEIMMEECDEGYGGRDRLRFPYRTFLQQMTRVMKLSTNRR